MLAPVREQQRIEAAKEIVDGDWEDVYAILVQIRKERARERCDTGRGAGLHLGPAYFVVGDVQRPGPALSPWRTVAGNVGAPSWLMRCSGPGEGAQLGGQGRTDPGM